MTFPLREKERNDMVFDVSIKMVQEWATEKGINRADDFVPQFKKVIEEVEELFDELERGNREEAKMELGDVFVTLIILAQQMEMNPQECLVLAYDKISRRKGKTVDGVFVKEEDLKED